MARTLRLFALLLLLCGGVHSAYALLPMQSGWRAVAPTGPVATGSTAQQACEKLSPLWDADLKSKRYFGGDATYQSNGRCLLRYLREDGSVQSESGAGLYSDDASCPVNSTPDGKGACQCSQGFNESGGQCVDANAQCKSKVGGIETVNWTAGWQRTPSVAENGPLIAPNNPGAVGNSCQGGCGIEFETGAACPGCKSYVSQAPNAQGLYRVSIDFRGRYTGVACQASASDAPTTPDDSKDPPCPGYVGEINGVKGCYGTADKPIKPGPNPVNRDLPQSPGNPPAGKAPAGQAGQTPAAGGGGSAGGPSSAAGGPAGSGGTGTVSGAGNGSGRVGRQDGTEQQNCGAPGQPICSVKVDETGTPTAGADGDKFSNAVDELKQTQADVIKGAGDGGPKEIGFAFSFPTGCSPIPINEFANGLSIDMCRWQGLIHDLMSMVWLGVTIWACIGMVGRTLHGGA